MLIHSYLPHPAESDKTMRERFMCACGILLRKQDPRQHFSEHKRELAERGE